MSVAPIATETPRTIENVIVVRDEALPDCWVEIAALVASGRAAVGNTLMLATGKESVGSTIASLQEFRYMNEIYDTFRTRTYQGDNLTCTIEAIC